MARNTILQNYGHDMNKFQDFGYAIFDGTSATVEITTNLSKVVCARFMPVAATANTNPAPGETFYIADAVSATTGFITVASNKLTLGRTGETFTSDTSFSADAFTGDDITETVLFTAPFAMTATSIVYTNSATAWVGSPLIDVGFADATPTELVINGAITVDAYASTSLTIAAASIASGAKVACLTTGGTTAAADSAITVNATRALSSATRVFYHLIGID